MQQQLLQNANQNNARNNRSGGGGGNCNCGGGGSGDCNCGGDPMGCCVVGFILLVGCPLLTTLRGVCVPQVPKTWIPDCVLPCLPKLPDHWTIANASSVAVKTALTLYIGYQLKTSWEATSPFMCTVYDENTGDPTRDPDGNKIEEDCSYYYYLMAFPLASFFAYVAVEGALKVGGTLKNYCCNSYSTVNTNQTTDLERGNHSINSNNPGPAAVFTPPPYVPFGPGGPGLSTTHN